MQTFASGLKRSYYGKADVIVYRLRRNGQAPAGRSPVFGANVMLLLYGDAFWTTYESGDNTNLIATDSMKNFIQRETLNYDGFDLEEFCRFLGDKFLATYPQPEGLQVTASEIPYAGVSDNGMAFSPSDPERGFARLEINRQGILEAVSGIHGFRLLRLGGSSFSGFIRDQYTTLPDILNRPLHMWLDVDWTYLDPASAFNLGSAQKAVREMVHAVFQSFASGSIQQLIHEIGTRILETMPAIAEIRLEANNRTWDTIAEEGERVGVFTEARPPYGYLGLRLGR